MLTISFVAYYGFGILKQLRVLNLRYNYFNDSILPYLNKLTSLTTLYLRQNSIEGSNPKEGNFSRYVRHAMPWNLIIINVYLLSKVYIFSLSIVTSNFLYAGLTNLSNLKKLDLIDNRITSGSITRLGKQSYWDKKQTNTIIERMIKTFYSYFKVILLLLLSF